MHDGELWQVFSENGHPLVGQGAIDDAFTDDTALVMGNSHVWFWKRTPEGVAVLLQKRSLTKKNAPGMYHISAAGHINVGETALEAAVRETQEEVGIAIDPAQLYLVHVTRTPRNLKSLLHVYIHELSGDEHFSFDDGEVERVEWFDLDTFYKMTEDAAMHQLIDQGRAYFDPLIVTIKRHAKQ
jgi:8-oxo-dGTP pyrophosphatase MutT (NUDIX family)